VKYVVGGVPVLYVLLADLLVAIHLAYVAYVVVGLLLILVGMVLKWRWIRNPWFRWSHLAMIAVVTLESVADIQCPLTVWENDLRKMAGAEVQQDSTFIGRMLHDIFIFDELEFNHWAFRVGYISFGALVLLAFVLVPPRGVGRRERPSDPSTDAVITSKT
jgi:hypothetical protein